MYFAFLIMITSFLSFLPSCQTSALSLSKLVNPIDPCFLEPVHGKRRIISYMPRKNKHEHEKIIALIKAQDWSKRYKFVPIVNCTQVQVAEIMRQSILFCPLVTRKALVFQLPKPWLVVVLLLVFLV